MRRADTINKMYSDLFNNIIPERVPNPQMLTLHVIGEIAGIEPIDVSFNFSLVADKAKEVASMIHSDTVPFFPVSFMEPRPPLYYQMLGSQSFQMGSKGFVQHPEVVGMMADEYDELIRDPYGLMLEKVIPRQYKNLNPEKGIELWRSIKMSQMALQRDESAILPAFMDLFMSGEYYEGPPEGSMTYSEAPTDFVADQLRGFSEFSKDVRRKRKQIIEASEALIPFMFHWGLPSVPHPEGYVMFPLHMPSFMRPKDVEEIWMPSMLKVVQQYASLGVRSCICLEEDWTQLLDIIQEFPAGTIMMPEKGDPKLFKEKLGDKFILTGMFPISTVRYGTKEETIDKVHEFLDIMAPGGGYYFGFDRIPLLLGDINWENYVVMTKEVEKYGVYDNSGQSYGHKLNEENYIYDEQAMAIPKSKYSFDWNEYKKEFPLTPDDIRPMLENYDRDMVKSVLDLLI